APDPDRELEALLDQAPPPTPQTTPSSPQEDHLKEKRKQMEIQAILISAEQLAQQDEYEDAIRELQRGLGKFPHHPQLQEMLTQVQQQQALLPQKIQAPSSPPSSSELSKSTAASPSSSAPPAPEADIPYLRAMEVTEVLEKPELSFTLPPPPEEKKPKNRDRKTHLKELLAEIYGEEEEENAPEPSPSPSSSNAPASSSPPPTSPASSLSHIPTPDFLDELAEDTPSSKEDLDFHDDLDQIRRRLEDL
ncbi:MAG: hypothetical protein D6805_04580, partial [Planctomycetota bacterium]